LRSTGEAAPIAGLWRDQTAGEGSALAHFFDARTSPKEGILYNNIN